MNILPDDLFQLVREVKEEKRSIYSHVLRFFIVVGFCGTVSAWLFWIWSMVLS